MLKVSFSEPLGIIMWLLWGDDGIEIAGCNGYDILTRVSVEDLKKNKPADFREVVKFLVKNKYLTPTDAGSWKLKMEVRQ